MCVTPGPDGGPQDKPTGGEHEHLRDNRQQQALPERVHHPLSQQNRPAGRQDSYSGHSQVLSRVQRRPTQTRGRTGTQRFFMLNELLKHHCHPSTHTYGSDMF